jgi:hypothetical protein
MLFRWAMASSLMVMLFQVFPMTAGPPTVASWRLGCLSHYLIGLALEKAHASVHGHSSESLGARDEVQLAQSACWMLR